MGDVWPVPGGCAAASWNVCVVLCGGVCCSVCCSVWCMYGVVCVVWVGVSLRAGGVLFKTRTQYQGVLGKNKICKLHQIFKILFGDLFGGFLGP